MDIYDIGYYAGFIIAIVISLLILWQVGYFNKFFKYPENKKRIK